jgi:hypothetical protein
MMKENVLKNVKRDIMKIWIVENVKNALESIVINVQMEINV